MRISKSIKIVGLTVVGMLMLSAPADNAAAQSTGVILSVNGPGAWGGGNFSALATASGKSYQTASSVPSDLSAYDGVILNLRFGAANTFSAAELSTLAAYVQSGGVVVAISDGFRLAGGNNVPPDGVAAAVGSAIRTDLSAPLSK